MIRVFNTAIWLLVGIACQSQNCGSTSITEQGALESTCTEVTMTAKADILGRPFLYIASKEGGLKIADIVSEPQEVASISTSLFESLHVNSMTQQGNYLYLAVGNSFSDGQGAGLVVVDVSNPETAFVADYLIVPGSADGSGMVAVEGNRAYLAAMSKGVVVFDIADPSNISIVSQFIPEISFPDNPDPDKVNARCIAIRDEILFLCYDAGGLRVLDISDEENIVEIGHFANPELNGLPRAYNNLVIDGDYAYITVDYCGLEVIDISNISSPGLASWWNPWDCSSNPFNWFSSPGHTNEIVMDEDCQMLFVAAGKSDLYVLDVSDPLTPDSCMVYGGVENNIGTWGVSMRGDSLYLSYICAIIPFASNWTGVKILEWQSPCSTGIPDHSEDPLLLMPNPVFDELEVRIPLGVFVGMTTWELFDAAGKLVDVDSFILSASPLRISAGDLTQGLYHLRISDKSCAKSCRFIKLDP